MSLRRTFLLACALVAAVPTAAQAAVTVSKSGSTVLIASTGGEDNSVYVSPGSGDLVVEDYAVDPVAGPGCTAGSSQVTCPTSGVTTIRAELGGGDDSFETQMSGLRHELFGQAGEDSLEGNEAADVLDGGSGSDDLYGLGGNDRLLARDGGAENIDCGGGDDDAVLDRSEYGADCEITAPWLEGAVILRAGNEYAEGSYISPDIVGDSISLGGTRNIDPFVDANRWYRCDAGGGNCTIVQSERSTLTYRVTAADVGSRLYFEDYLMNRAGEARLTTPMSPVVVARVVPVMPPFPTDHAVPTPDFKTMLQGPFDMALRAGVAKVLKTRPRTLAKGTSVKVTVTPPWDGVITLKWTVSKAAARKLGIKSKGPVTIASGMSVAKINKAGSVTLKFTSTGRKLMRRANKRLKIGVAGSLKSTAGVTLPVVYDAELRGR
jgi:hypothetical protein